MKPGLYAVTRWPNANEWPDDTSRVLMQEEDGYLVAVDGDPSAPFAVPPTVRHYARPLVVLDPESDEDQDRFLDAASRYGTDYQSAKECLRALAAPTPAEPMGLGAVVRDARGRLWVNNPLPLKRDANPWRRSDGLEFAEWSEIDSPEVLTEGWTP